MKEIVIKVPEKEYEFFMRLIKNLRFVKVETVEGDSKEEIVNNLKKGFEEMKEFKEGKKKGTPLNEFLDEL